MVLPKSTRVLLYDDVAVSYYPDGNLTFSLCAVRDSSVVAFHCTPEHLIVLDKSEKVAYLDTYLNQLGMLLVNSQAKFETRLAF